MSYHSEPDSHSRDKVKVVSQQTFVGLQDVLKEYLSVSNRS